MNPEAILDRVKQLAEDLGFNLFKTVSSGDYEKLVPEQKSVLTIFPQAKSISLIGFGGNHFWEVLQNYLKDNPEFTDKGEDLIDNYTKMVFLQLSHSLDDGGVKHTSVFPFGEDAMALDFVKLGEASGAGVPSILGVLIHPDHGPWLSLRGALLLDIYPERYDGALKDFDPCPSCDKPCIAACPAKTVSEKGWDWESCMKFRISDSTCSSNCASRRACPYGKETQYSEEQLEYHHKFVLRNVRSYFKQS